MSLIRVCDCECHDDPCEVYGDEDGSTVIGDRDYCRYCAESDLWHREVWGWPGVVKGEAVRPAPSPMGSLFAAAYDGLIRQQMAGTVEVYRRMAGDHD